MEKDWIITDADRQQYGRKISENVYEFKEYNQLENDWDEIKIDLTDYTLEEIESMISPYYQSIQQVKQLYEDNSNWIIAECIFEQETGIY